jgi:hypothetical protein
MAYVPGFTHDIFISYAHFDNQPDAQKIQWVSEFRTNLTNALTERLGKDLEIFFDSKDLHAGHQLEHLLKNARESAIFLAVFSPSYVQREWTIKELAAFSASKDGGQQIVAIEVLEVDETDYPPQIEGLKRTLFYDRDKESDTPLKLTPASHCDVYNQRLQILAHQLVKLLRELRAKRQSSAAPAGKVDAVGKSLTGPLAGKTVLLAQVTTDLYDEREQVLAFLEQYGVKVVPESDYLQGGAEFARALKADLERADLFVQLLGPSRSLRPADLKDEGDDAPKSYAQFQYDAATRRKIPVLQWRRPDLDPAMVTHWDKPLLEKPEIMAMGLQEFMKEIRRALERPQAETEAEPKAKRTDFLFINADRSDKPLADALLKAFEDNPEWMAATPLFEGSADAITKDLDANLMDCGGLMLVYGNADAPWVRAQLRRYSKLERFRDEPPRLKKILFAPPTPKPEISWSGGFKKVDCEDGVTPERVHKIVTELDQ